MNELWKPARASKLWPGGESRLWKPGDPSGLPRNGLVGLWDPYRDAYGLDATARAALQTGVDYSGRGNSLTYGATTNASTDDPVNTGTAWSFDGGDYLLCPSALLDPFPNGTPATLCCVFKTGADVTKQQEVFDLGSFVAPPYDGYRILIASSKVYAQYGATDSRQGGVVGNISASTTYCVIATYTATSISGWVGATKTTLGSLTGALLKPTAGFFGCDIGLANFLSASGTLIHFGACWPRVLTDAEVTRTYRYVKSLMAGRGVTVA